LREKEGAATAISQLEFEQDARAKKTPK